MGKCSGLKAGGHHRKAIDVANKKRNEKQSIKKEKEAAGKRAIALQEILSGKLGSIYTDCDIYLQQQAVDNDGSKEGGGTSSSTSNSNIELCREHFRFENCSNRRCKFSHEYTIVDALQNVISGTNTTTNNDNSDYDGSDDNNTPATIPALQFLPGITTTGGGRQKRPHRSRMVVEHNVMEHGVSSLQLDNHTTSPLENASIVNTIITYIKSNNDVLNLALTCRYMHQTILFDEDGCPDVMRRKQRVKESQLEERNKSLLANSKSTGGRLRYVVGYVEGGINNSTKGGSSKKKGNNKKANKNRKNDTASTYCTKPQRRRPVLIYDYENPNVFVAFREYALSVAKKKSNVMLESQNENDES